MKRYYWNWTILGILALLTLFGWFGYLLSTTPKAKAPDVSKPVVVAYKVTYYAPTGEVKTLYTTRYRAGDPLWVRNETDTDYIILRGDYIIEPVIK